jgi:hypothetical protein
MNDCGWYLALIKIKNIIGRPRHVCFHVLNYYQVVGSGETVGIKMGLGTGGEGCLKKKYVHMSKYKLQGE